MPSPRALRRPSRSHARNLAAAVASPFPPAKSDDEIATLVDQMGAELGVFDPRAQKVARTIRIDTAMRSRAHESPAPPPVPDWALDATITRRPGTRRPGTRLRAG